MDSGYAMGWHENRGTRSRTVESKKKKKENGGERKSPVMPRGGMRIKEPGRGPWYQREKKGKWRRKEVSCYATGWHENKETRSRTVELKKKKGSRGLLLCHGVA